MEKRDNNQTDQKSKNTKAPTILIVFSAFSFIPLIGLFFGGISIIISLFNFKRFKSLFIIGLSGILFTIIIYSTLYYFGFKKRGGVYDELRTSMNITLLKEINREIDIYKLRHGTYPTDLYKIDTKENLILTIKDPIVEMIDNYKGDSLFHYQVKLDTFELFSVGLDGIPYTDDDIYHFQEDPLVNKK
jgi:hypothetical protein